MTKKQKAKAVARLLDRFIQEEGDAMAALRAWYAPAECWAKAINSIEREHSGRLRKALAAVGATEPELDKEFRRWTEQEEPHRRPWEMPFSVEYRHLLSLLEIR